MLASLDPCVPELSLGSCSAGLEAPLALLLTSYESARQVGCCLDEAAVCLSVLRQAGLSYLDLQWLVRHGYVTHSTARQPLQEDSPSPGRVVPCSAPVGVTITLTDLGALFARWVLLSTDGPFMPDSQGACATVNDTGYILLPHWDRQRKELRLGTVLVKRFTRPAPNQELILDSFEEEGWPDRIDDPLPLRINQDPKERLHDAIKCLNRHCSLPLVHFQGDGTGRGVRWELQGRSSPHRPPSAP